MFGFDINWYCLDFGVYHFPNGAAIPSWAFDSFIWASLGWK